MTTTNVFEGEPPSCPVCASDRVVPIIYTPPSDEMLIAAKMGHLVLGDTQASAATAHWKCQSGSCDYSF
jgi:hypothetical protein